MARCAQRREGTRAADDVEVTAVTELRPTRQFVPLAEICRQLRLPAVPGRVSGLTLDTRLVQPGDLFAALPGAHTHGANFAGTAVAAGATAILTDAEGASLLDGIDVPVLVDTDPRARLGLISTLVYPGQRPSLVGITGTNGKTTTAHCIAAAAEAAGVPTAILGTLGVRFRELHDYSGRTTLEAPSLHAALSTLAEAGAGLAAMEVSSHALALHRVDGLLFDVAVFLGLTQDHLDFHPTMDDYFSVKSRLFTERHSRCAVINVDDTWGEKMAAACAVPCTTYGLTEAAEWHPRDIVVDGSGRTHFTAVGPGVELPVNLSMPGGFNVANALAALAAVSAIGLDVRAAAGGLAHVYVPGRFERINNERGIGAYVDYAHTPDAVTRVLDVARAATRGRLITVLGCGGDRDAAKRPLMGAAAAQESDIVIVTDDNPRSEDPAAIRRAVLDGAGTSAGVFEIGDRAAAIDFAVETAETGDCIMVLGKGHEAGQEIGGVLHPFDDRVELRRALGVTP